LAHNKANLLCLFVAEKLTVSGPTLLPLVVSEAVKLASNLEDAFFLLITCWLRLDLGELRLSKCQIRNEKKNVFS
jgi:hypothetical protein